MLPQLLRASIDGAIAVALVWLLCRAIPRLTGATRAWLWWLAAAKFVVALVWTAPIPLPLLPAQPVEIVSERGSLPSVMADVVPIDESIAVDGAGVFAARPVAPPANPWPAALNVLWIAGVIVAAGLAARDWRRASRLVARSSPATPEILGIVQPLSSRLLLGRVPEVRLSPDVDTPLVVGVGRPVVLLPAPGFARLSPRQRQMSICHELVHIRRADLHLGCVPALAELLFFFHPFTRLAAREYALAREAACDAAVLEALDAAPQEYGRLLVDLGVAEPRARLSAAGASWSSSILKRRLVMLNNLSSVSSASRVLAAVAVAVAAVSVVPVKLVARQAAPPPAVSPAAKPITTTTTEAKSSATTVSTAKQPLTTTAVVPQVKVKSATPAQQKPAPVVRTIQKPTPKWYVGPADDQTIVIGSDVVLFRGATSTAADANAFRYRFFLRKAADSDTQMNQAIERAKTFRKEGESMIWFKRNDHEYVVRDADTIKEVETLLGAPRFYSTNYNRSATPADLTAQVQEMQVRLAELAAQLKADKADPAKLQTAALGRQLESLARRLQEPAWRYSLSSTDRAAWVSQPNNAEIFAALDRAIAKGTAQQVK